VGVLLAAPFVSFVIRMVKPYMHEPATMVLLLMMYLDLEIVGRTTGRATAFLSRISHAPRRTGALAKCCATPIVESQFLPSSEKNRSRRCPGKCEWHTSVLAVDCDDNVNAHLRH